MDKDQLLLEDLYMQMYDEKLSWKHKALGGLGALGLAAGATNLAKSSVPSIPVNKVDISQTGRMSPKEISYIKAKTPREFKQLIKDYYNSMGHNVEVALIGDDIHVYSRTQDKSVSFPLQEFKDSITFGRNEGDATKANLYLDTWIN